jgi:hypothetical protein
MAIAPIDLQTLFTQLDKVGKTQISQREGVEMQQAMHGAQLQRKTEEHIQEVNEAQNTGEGVEKTGDRGQRNQADKKKERRRKEEEDGEDGRPSVLHDPCLGRNIDIVL